MRKHIEERIKVLQETENIVMQQIAQTEQSAARLNAQLLSVRGGMIELNTLKKSLEIEQDNDKKEEE